MGAISSVLRVRIGIASQVVKLMHGAVEGEMVWLNSLYEHGVQCTKP